MKWISKQTNQWINQWIKERMKKRMKQTNINTAKVHEAL